MKDHLWMTLLTVIPVAIFTLLAEVESADTPREPTGVQVRTTRGSVVDPDHKTVAGAKICLQRQFASTLLDERLRREGRTGVKLVSLQNRHGEILSSGNGSALPKVLVNIRGLTELWFLNLDGTDVPDAGLEYLRGMSKLTHLLVHGTKVMPAGIARLKIAVLGVNVQGP